MLISRNKLSRSFPEAVKDVSSVYNLVEKKVEDSGAPNDQFVEKCIIMPQLMKIYVNNNLVPRTFSLACQGKGSGNEVVLIRHFQVFFNIAGKKLSVPFSQQGTQEISQPGRKIGWFSSQLQIEQPAGRKTTIF